MFNLSFWEARGAFSIGYSQNLIAFGISASSLPNQNILSNPPLRQLSETSESDAGCFLIYIYYLHRTALKEPCVAISCLSFKSSNWSPNHYPTECLRVVYSQAVGWANIAATDWSSIYCNDRRLGSKKAASDVFWFVLFSVFQMLDCVFDAGYGKTSHSLPWIMGDWTTPHFRWY